MIGNIKNPRSITSNSCIWIIVLCVFLSAIWATLPLMGWSYYSPEGVKMSCGVEWQDHSINVMSYNITIMIFAFVVPLTILVITNMKVIRIVLFYLFKNFTLGFKSLILSLKLLDILVKIRMICKQI